MRCGSGPVVVSQAGFSAYYRDRARPWERIALARAAVLSASMEGFADDLGRALAALRRIDSPQVLVEEAREMRRRQVAALRSTGSPLDFLKRGQGGLADLEFAVACMQLTQREGHPARSEADPLLALAALADDGALSISEAQALASDYRVLRRAEARIRFARSLASRSVEELQGPGRGPEGLSRSMLSSEDLSDVVAASMQRILLLSRELMSRVEATC